MASLIWADPTRPITEAMVTYWASEGVSNSMHWKGSLCVQSFVWSSRARTPSVSRNVQACLLQKSCDAIVGLALALSPVGTHCFTSSGFKSKISLPWTTPALLISTVGCPIYIIFEREEVLIMVTGLTSSMIFFETASTSSHFETSHL